MTTVQWVFEKAIHLMDEQDEDGKFDNAEDYKLRTLNILNVLRHELYSLSDNYPASENGKRPVLKMLETFEDEIGLDDAIAQGILPYGLAAYLHLGEDNTKASFFNQKYEELKASFRLRSSAVWEDIPFQFM